MGDAMISRSSNNGCKIVEFTATVSNDWQEVDTSINIGGKHSKEQLVYLIDCNQ